MSPSNDSDETRFEFEPSMAGLETFLQTRWLWQRLPEISTGSPPDINYLRRVVAQVVRRLDLRERS